MLSEVVTEGRKFGMRSLSDAQEWSANSVKSTAVRGLLETFFQLRVDNRKETFFLDGRDKRVPGFTKGEYILRQKGPTPKRIIAPLLSADDVAALAEDAPQLAFDAVQGVSDSLPSISHEHIDNVTPIRKFRHW